MDASKIVMEYLNNRKRGAERTDLSNAYRIVKRDYPKLDEDAFMDVFKAMQSNGLGTMIIGRGGNPNRFVWKYKLQEVVEKLKAEAPKKETAKVVRRTPAKASEPSQIVINLPANTAKKEIEALISLVQSLDVTK